MVTARRVLGTAGLSLALVAAVLAGRPATEARTWGYRRAHVRAHILGVPHVHAVHDLHANSVSSDLPVLTAHVVVDDSCFRDGHLPRLLDQLQQCLAGHFDVEHSTVQFEPASHAAHEHPAHA
jgi:cobalt-zinc-cadmium efflux system protein